jgi:hypothetical protein
LYHTTNFSNAKNKVRDYISEHFGVSQLYLTHPTFFSRLDSKASSTVHDEYWHLHIDRETYPNFHYTSLLYLTDHGVDFNGGEFVFVDSHDKLNRLKTIFTFVQLLSKIIVLQFRNKI